MSEKRRLRSVFQDNSDLISDRWEIFHNILLREWSKVNDTMHNCQLSIEIVSKQHDDRKFFSFTWVFPPMDMNIFVGNIPHPIQMGEVEVNLLISIDKLIVSLCNDSTCFSISENNEEIITFERIGTMSNYNQFKAYHKPVYDSNSGIHLVHPFISNYRNSERVIDNDDFNNTCLGDLTGRAWSELMNLNLLSLTLTLMQWLTTYNSRDTRPLNNIKYSFWGLPERVNHPDFIAVYGNDPTNCQYPDHEDAYEEQSIGYCENVSCALRESCVFYLEATGQEVPATVEPEQALTEEDLPFDTEHEVVADNADNIHGGEVPIQGDREQEELAEFARIQEEEYGIRVEEEDVNEAHIPTVGEEDVIAWAARNGNNLINIRREQ